MVLVIPNCLAFLVINFAKFLSDFPKFSATTVATSFADLVIKAIIAFFTVILDPGERCNLDGGCLDARLDTFNLVFIDIFLDSKASKIIYKVMIFVSDAG